MRRAGTGRLTDLGTAGRLPRCSQHQSPGQSGDASRRSGAGVCPLPTRIVLSYLMFQEHPAKTTRVAFPRRACRPQGAGRPGGRARTKAPAAAGHAGSGRAISTPGGFRSGTRPAGSLRRRPGAARFARHQLRRFGGQWRRVTPPTPWPASTPSPAAPSPPSPSLASEGNPGRPTTHVAAEEDVSGRAASRAGVSVSRALS